jgi:hypothetical protein
MSKKIKTRWPLGMGAGICVQDNVLPSALCRSIIKFFEEHPHYNHPGQTLGGVSPNTKLSMDAHIMVGNQYAKTEAEREFLRKTEDEVFQLYGLVLQEYTKQYVTLATEWTVRQDTGYQYQRYSQNKGFYASHIDGAPHYRNGSNERVLASVMYLNTVKKGGGTFFDHFDYTCKAVEGRIVTFPTTFLHLHGGLVPRSSDKCIISTFVCSPEQTADGV